mmetsp:Transcript_34104/g.54589  ORF Transcript_34104/g.54589 Transcript_34104/m.54589 type:complete len:140 (+) Transcript_34104:215-634(+)
MSYTVEDKERVRFEQELEFIQCLSNPRYLNHLAQQLVLEDEAFISYLEYLQYWKRPEYAKFVLYPHCLYFIDLLQDKEFREKLKDPQVCEMIHTQQFFHWQYLHGKPQEGDGEEQKGPEAGQENSTQEQEDSNMETEAT